MMTTRSILVLSAALAAAMPGLALAVPGAPEPDRQSHPRDGEIHDEDTRSWWHTTEALSGDSMQGRDTGTPAYQRAAQLVAARFKAAGLMPAGDGGGYLQSVPMNQVTVWDGSQFVLLRRNGSRQMLKFLEQITVSPAADLPQQIEAPLTFRGYCGKEALENVMGKVVVCFGTQRSGLPSGSERAANVRAAHALAIVNVDDPYFTIEPPRWPYAYAHSVTLRDSVAEAGNGTSFAVMRISAEAFDALLSGAGRDAKALLRQGGAKEALPNFEIPSRLKVHMETRAVDIQSPNVLGMLPGSDPALAGEYLVVSAHLDGYGFGAPVNGDRLYNGTLDDAAYVALLIQMADNLHAGRLPAPRRSILFAAFTGEEKGLLGSHWYVNHPTIALDNTVANVNLDQLRPLFPLEILTAEAVDDTTLGATARRVGEEMKIVIRRDAEPERNLLRRADQYPFLEKHVPAISFIFGYDSGTESERRYREWYQTRYHRPQDDLMQPIDFDAAGKFDQFFYRLVGAIANDARRPTILADSPFAPIAR